MASPSAIAPNVLDAVFDSLAEHPFHASCGLRVERYSDGKGRVSFALNETTLNSAGLLHGGVLYGLMDVACFVAAFTTLEPGQQIVTHDIHCSILAPISGDNQSAWIDAEVERRGRTLIFVRATCWSTMPDGQDKKIGLCTLTKSIVENRFAKLKS